MWRFRTGPTSRTLQSWPRKPQPPICATRRGRCPTRPACTSGARPRERALRRQGRARCESACSRTSRASPAIARATSSSRGPRRSRRSSSRARDRGAAARAELIKRYRPPFNVRLRDDKSYPYIAVTVDDEYPRVLFTRERHRSGVRYFGPYASAQKVRSTLETLNKIFPYRPCEGPTPGRRSGVPCLDYHIGRCAAPCVGLITREDYREVIDDVIAFLEGRTKPIERDLEQRMREASERQEFEEAARPRNRLIAVRTPRASASRRLGSRHLRRGRRSPSRATSPTSSSSRPRGRLDERRSLYLENADARARGRAAGSFLPTTTPRRSAIPPLVVRAPRGRGRRGDRGVPLPAPRRDGRAARRRARRQAAHARAGPAQRRARRAPRRAARAAHAGAPRRGARGAARGARPRGAADPHRVLRHLEPAGDERRRLDGRVRGAAPRSAPTTAGSAIRHDGGQDDFRSIAEAVSRRFARYRRVEEDGYDRSFATLPNLVVIDGGKGQLAAALDAMRELRPAARRGRLARQARGGGLPPRPLAAGAAAARLAGAAAAAADPRRGAPLRAPRPPHAPGGGQTASLLDTLPGVGPVRRRALIAHFGDVARLLEASRAELEAVPGLPAEGRAERSTSTCTASAATAPPRSR